MIHVNFELHTMEDGTVIEGAHVAALDGAKGCLVVWPCMGGDCRMYRVPAEAFAEKGWDILFYNPRGHGRSQGSLAIATAGEDLKALMAHYGVSDLPRVAFGHSGGCSALLKAASSGMEFLAYFFAAPVLNSRRSLFYMYKEKTIREFVYVTSRLAADPDLYQALLSDTHWLDESYWHSANLREVLNGGSEAFPIGSFLEELFIPGIDAMADLAPREAQTTIFFPAHDNWYPHDTTREESGEELTTILMPEATDHYFSCGWHGVWDQVLERLPQDAPLGDEAPCTP